MRPDVIGPDTSGGSLIALWIVSFRRRREVHLSGAWPSVFWPMSAINPELISALRFGDPDARNADCAYSETYAASQSYARRATIPRRSGLVGSRCSRAGESIIRAGAASQPAGAARDAGRRLLRCIGLADWRDRLRRSQQFRRKLGANQQSSRPSSGSVASGTETDRRVGSDGDEPATRAVNYDSRLGRIFATCP